MASTRSLDLPQSPRATVFRAMETIVRNNPTFQRVVKPDNFRTWQGHPRDSKPFDQSNAPAMRWTPQNTGEQFRTPELISGDLLINCEILCRGSCVDDLTNFWWMLARCFYPEGGGNNPIVKTLVGAGARSGLVFFTQPAFDPGPDGVFTAGQGQLKIEVQSQINS